MIVVMHLMKHHPYVRTSTVIHYVDSNAITIVVLHDTRFVMALTIAVTVVMKII